MQVYVRCVCCVRVRGMRSTARNQYAVHAYSYCVECSTQTHVITHRHTHCNRMRAITCHESTLPRVYRETAEMMEVEMDGEEDFRRTGF